MITWLEILCAVDFTASSRAALEHAADLARRFDARLALVHVWRGARAAGPGLAVAPPALTLGEEAELGRKLDDWKREAERLAGREVPAVLTSGAPAEEVVRLAAERHVDLVVVGTHGSGDEEALEQILRGGAGHVSLIASRKRAAAITRTLAERGVAADRTRRLKAPAGLDIGATTPSEIAVSILDRVLEVRRR